MTGLDPSIPPLTEHWPLLESSPSPETSLDSPVGVSNPDNDNEEEIKFAQLLIGKQGKLFLSHKI